MQFTVACFGSEPLVLRETLECFTSEQWLTAHASREEAVEIVLDQFKRTIGQVMAVMEVRAEAMLSGKR